MLFRPNAIVLTSVTLTLRNKRMDDGKTGSFVWRNIEARSCNQFFCGKAVSITYSVCVCECVRMHSCVCVGMGVGHGRWCLCLRACSLSNPARNAPPYSHLRPLWLHLVFRHYLINGTIFGKKSLKIERLFWFSLQRVLKTFYLLTRLQRDIVINVETWSYEVPFMFVRF
jgi:hypothetical protein